MSNLQFPPEGTPSARQLRFQLDRDSDDSVYISAADLLVYVHWLIEADPEYPLSAFEKSMQAVVNRKREEMG